MDVLKQFLFENIHKVLCVGFSIFTLLMKYYSYWKASIFTFVNTSSFVKSVLLHWQ